MDTTTRAGLVMAFAIAVLLLLLFGGGMVTGAAAAGGVLAQDGHLGAISWMWIPAVLALDLGALVAWAVGGRN